MTVIPGGEVGIDRVLEAVEGGAPNALKSPRRWASRSCSSAAFSSTAAVASAVGGSGVVMPPTSGGGACGDAAGSGAPGLRWTGEQCPASRRLLGTALVLGIDRGENGWGYRVRYVDEKGGLASRSNSRASSEPRGPSSS